MRPWPTLNPCCRHLITPSHCHLVTPTTTGVEPVPLHPRWAGEVEGFGTCPTALLVALMQQAERCTDSVSLTTHSLHVTLTLRSPLQPKYPI